MITRRASDLRARGLATVRRHPVVGQFLRYASVGVLNTAIFFVLFNLLLSLPIAPPLAYVAAFMVANLNSFVLNKRWSFRDTGTRVVGQYLLFMVFTGLTAAGVFFVLNVQLAHLGRLGHNLAALAVLPLAVAWNFTAYRRWTFRSRADRAPVAS